MIRWVYFRLLWAGGAYTAASSVAAFLGSQTSRKASGGIQEKALALYRIRFCPALAVVKCYISGSGQGKPAVLQSRCAGGICLPATRCRLDWTRERVVLMVPLVLRLYPSCSQPGLHQGQVDEAALHLCDDLH